MVPCEPSSGGNGQVLVLALGNDLLADDGVALLAARQLRERVGPGVVVRECGEAGMALLEELAGFRAAVILDTVVTGEKPPGMVHRLSLEELSPVVAPSPHWAGLPEVVTCARELGVAFPENVAVFAVEASDVTSVGKPPCPEVAAAVPHLVRQVLEAIRALANS